MSLEIDKALIKKYLNGDCSPEELQLVRIFLKQANAQATFDEVWDEQWSDKIYPDSNQADSIQKQIWKTKIGERIYNDAFSTPITKKLYQKPKFWSYAAIWFVAIIGAGLFVANHNKKENAGPLMVYDEMINPKGQRTLITLPDSSEVYLGALSKIRFAKNFDGKTREVLLEGEAFFNVAKNPKRPFIIQTENIRTQVLGTSFKVEAFKGKPISVQVSTGKVRVDRKFDNDLIPIAMLLPGQAVVWNEQKQQKTLAQVAIEDVIDWKEGHLNFEQTQLAEITSILERWYDVKITIENDRLAKKLIKVNLTTNIAIDKIMKILSAAGSFNYNIHENHITIKK